MWLLVYLFIVQGHRMPDVLEWHRVSFFFSWRSVGFARDVSWEFLKGQEFSHKFRVVNGEWTLASLIAFLRRHEAPRLG